MLHVMKAASLQDGILSNYEDLVKYSRDIKQKFDADKIHKLRIAFKKLRAILRWQHTDKKIFYTGKKIYSVAGMIRNIQIVKKMLGREEDLPESFNVWLSAKLSELKIEWYSLNIDKQLRRFRNILEKIHPDSKTNKHFFSESVEKIKGALDTVSIADSALHNIRKRARDIQYDLKYWQSKKRKDFLKNHFSIKNLKVISSQIGAYNDKRVLIGFLETYLQEMGEQTFIEKIHLAIAKWQQRKILQKERLLKRLIYLELEINK
jgi:CHAD domain-containing protein